MQKFTITSKESGRRLDQYLNRLLPGAGTSFIYRMLRKKNITVNRAKADGKLRLTEGDTVEMFFSEETFAKFSGASTALDTGLYERAYRELSGISIVYEDDDFIFIDKPVGVLSQTASGSDISVNEWLIGYLLDKGGITADELTTFKPAFCNRLDRNTTGLVLGGKNLKALGTLSELFRDRDKGLHKYYKVRVSGHPDKNLPVTEDAFTDFYASLIKDHRTNKVRIAAAEEDGEKIHTGFRLISEDTESMELEAELFTGKTHQIRAQLSALSHPVIGDAKYGGKTGPKAKYQELRAYRVVFPHIPEYPNISDREFRID